MLSVDGDYVIVYNITMFIFFLIYVNDIYSYLFFIQAFASFRSCVIDSYFNITPTAKGMNTAQLSHIMMMMSSSVSVRYFT